MENASDKNKYGVVIFGQQFCDKLEHIPIKKRILLRDSALYQRTPPPAQVADQKSSSPTVQLSELPGSPSAHLSDPNLISKQQADSLESGQLVDKRRELEALNNVKANHSQDISVINTPIGSTCIDRSKTVEYANKTDTGTEVTCSDRSNTVHNADKDPIVEASSSCSGINLPSVSIVLLTANNDDMDTKTPECIPLSVETGDSFSNDRPAVLPDNVSHKANDCKTEHSATQDNRILWDLNVSMEDWEKTIDDQTHVTSYDCMPSMETEKSESCKLKVDDVVSNSVNERDRLPTVSSMTSGSLPPTADFTNFMIFKSVEEDRQIIGSTISRCDQNLGYIPDDKRTLMLGEGINKLSSRARGSNSTTTPLRTEFVSDQDFENKNTVIEGEGSGILLPVRDDDESGSPKSRMSFKSGELEVIATEGSSSNRHMDILEKCGYDEEGNESRNMDEKIVCNTKADVTKLHPSDESTGKSSQLVVVKTGEEARSSSHDVFSAHNVEPPYAPKTNNMMPNIEKAYGTLTEQDYEDGELRELDSHGWNNLEMGETDCLDYEPDDVRKDFISSSTGGKDDGVLERKISRFSKIHDEPMVRNDGANADDKVASGISDGGCSETRASNKRLEKKLSGWDQLPRDGQAPSDKALEELGISSRASRSDLQPCIDIQTLSEDAEEKETVVEQKIRPKNIDDSYPAESSFGFSKFTEMRRSTSHMHGRNRMEEWDSERRSSINYQDVYDNYLGSTRSFMSSRGRGHHRRSRSRSPSDRNDSFEAHNNYSRFSRGRFGRRTEGSCRGLRGARSGYRGSLADDHIESEFCMPQQYLRRERSFSPRGTPHFSETFNRSRSRSRSRSPPHWLSSDERVGSRGRLRSPGFRTEDRLKRTRLTVWKTSFTADNETRYPPRGGFMPHNKSRWNGDEDFEMSGPRDRSPMRSFRHKEKFNPACSRGRFRSGDDSRPLGYCGRMREITSPDRSRGYLGGIDRRKREGSFETGHPKRYFKDNFSQQYRHDPENNTAPQNCLVKDDFLEDGESRLGNMRKKERRSVERYEQMSYQGSTPKAKR